MHPTWRGHSSLLGRYSPLLIGKFTVLRRATQVMRGR